MQTKSINLPIQLVQRLEHAAKHADRSVEEIAAASLESSLPVDPELPEEIAAELAAMHVFSDDALWSASEPTFKSSAQARIQELIALAEERELTSEEQQENQELVQEYKLSVLRRAKALSTLAQRGHQISPT
jgi:hypothetical protein